MKVLLVNGSPRANSNTLLGLHEMQISADVLRAGVVENSATVFLMML